MKKYLLGAVFAGVVLLFVLSAPVSSPALCKDCNIVLISLDTVGAKHLSVYNPELTTTPLLQKRANEHGVVFENAYAQAPWTLPSHAAMLTGKYPAELGIRQFLDAVPLSATTLAEQLLPHGYRTALFSIGSFVQPQWQFDQGFETVEGSMLVTDWNDLPGLFNQARAWIANQDETKPYFVMVRPFEAHDPYRDGTNIHTIVSANKTADQESLQRTGDIFEASYRNDLEYVDQALNLFLEQLPTTNRKTVVIITADHGEEFGEHGTIGLHGTTVFSESIHVPLIFFIPEIAPRTVASSVEVRSIPASVLDIVGVPYKKDIGPSLIQHITGVTDRDFVARAETTISRDELLSTIEKAYENVTSVHDGSIVPTERTAPYTGASTQAIIVGSQKAIKSFDGSVSYFDLSVDPEEQYPKESLLGASLHDMQNAYHLQSLSWF